MLYCVGFSYILQYVVFFTTGTYLLFKLRVLPAATVVEKCSIQAIERERERERGEETNGGLKWGTQSLYFDSSVTRDCYIVYTEFTQTLD